MAITRTQIAKQLLAQGGRTGFQGGGKDMAGVADSKGNVGPSASSGSIDRGNTAREQGITNQYQGPGGTTQSFDRGPTEIIGGKEFAVNPPTRFEEEQKNFAISIENDRQRREAKKRALRKNVLFKDISLRDKLMLDPTVRTLDDNLVDIGAIDPQFKTIGGLPTGFVGPAIGALTVDPATNFFDQDSIREIASTKTTTGGSLSATDADTLGDIREDITMRDRILDPNDKVTQSEFDQYINRNKIEDTTGGDGIQDPCKGPNPPAYCFVGIRSVEPEVKEEDDDEIINYRLMAGGGMADETVGGIMDLESSRQMYGLGKLVKKVTRSVKKIAKSPIGKAAILAAGGYALGGGFAAGGFKKATLLSRLGLGSFDGYKRSFTKNALGKFLTNKATLGIGIPAIASYFMTPEEEEEKKLYAGADIDDPNTIINNPYAYTNPRLMAEGGSTEEKEPVAKKVMPLLDMDGKEKDYRETGGFVDMGRMEKADDVPARLSKNEFVFTADAVRNAGDGSVDKGAEVMYNMMKNLESGGDVSEESQGLEGARDMFQTSQRLEEVL